LASADSPVDELIGGRGVRHGGDTDEKVQGWPVFALIGTEKKVD